MGATTCFFVNSMASEAQELTRGLRRRDPDLLDRLIEQYHYRLFRYLMYLTGRRETAEDLFQETWIRVIERGHQYDAKWKFEAWLFSIARHLTIDLARKKSPLTWTEDLEEAGGTSGGQAAVQSGRPMPVSAVELVASREESERVAAALGGLPAAHREVLLLRFQEDMALDEIAQVTGAPLSTVKSRLYRGLEALRERLEGLNR
ncbi:MAG TPA: sigma-70 family RNA polymerase sigma factor [Terriglobia bacterium]|nr:sigma-70 family RNA polymerase sigma factor [Terriglobia bacterium]